MKNGIKSLTIGVIVSFSFIACGGGSKGENDSTKKSWNNSFEKYNLHFKRLKNSARFAKDLSHIKKTDWIITKKRGSSFYFLDFKLGPYTSYLEAKEKCESLNAKSISYKWKVSSVDELFIIRELHRPNKWFWTSNSEQLISSKYHYLVNLKDGFIYSPLGLYQVGSRGAHRNMLYA